MHLLSGSTAAKLATALWVCATLCACGGSSEGGASPPNPYTAFVNPTLVQITGYTGDAMEPFISKDGQYLFFNNSNDPSVNTDLYYASRVDDQTFTFLGPVPGVNGTSLDAVASLDSADNFYFISNRSYATSLATVYSGQFSAAGVTNVVLVPGISLQEADAVNFDAEISADGQTLWFDDGEYSMGQLQRATLAIANRQQSSFVRQANSAVLLAAVNTADLNYAPSISVDGLELLFTRLSTAPGSTPAIYRSTRPDTQSAFGASQWVSGASGFVEAPSLSADGHLLYFHKMENGTFSIYHLER